MSSVRHAVYYAPAPGGALARFGAAVLGRRPDGSPAPVAPGAPPCRAGRVARPRTYGFHATLKAPFRLAPDATPAALERALRALAARLEAVSLPELRLRHAGTSTVLDVAAPVAAVDALAAEVVTSLDRFRAPLDDAERARRGADRLDPAARARLERWGYPWVLDGFGFHLTLGAGGPPTTPAEDADWLGWLDALRRRLGPLDASLDRLSLCRQEAPDRPFVLVADVPLPPSDPPPPLPPS